MGEHQHQQNLIKMLQIEANRKLSIDETTVGETGVDKTVVDETGVDKPGCYPLRLLLRPFVDQNSNQTGYHLKKCDAKFVYNHFHSLLCMK